VEEDIRGGLRASAQLLLEVADTLSPALAEVAARSAKTLHAGNKLMLCGNGGSASQASHFAGEIVGRFRRERPGRPAIALTTDTAIITALGNDYGYEEIFRRQLEALAQPGDMLWAFSTSGNAASVVRAVQDAQQREVYSVGFTGRGGGELGALVDVCLKVPHEETSLIQEAHLAMGHLLCDLIERSIVH
jgi:D-sedoheptulose 7-phosphate isomerase